MNLKKISKSGFTLLLAAFVALTATGCSSKKTSSDGGGSTSGGIKVDEETGLVAGVDYDKAYKKMDEMTTVTLGVWQRDEDDAANITDNPFITFMREEYNIDIKFEWALPWEQHVEKVNMCINAGTLPDAVTIYSTQSVKELLANNSIKDLTPYKQYFGNGLKGAYDSYPDDACLKEVTVDGKLGALPSTAVGYQHEVLWIRNDWLEVLGLEKPKTFDDVAKIATAFATQDPDQNGKDDTYGIPFSSYRFGVDNTSSIDPLFAAFGSFPGAWLKGSDGKVVYGSTAPETKTALARLSELFTSRALFCEEDNNGQNIGNGKCGMVFGPWWNGDNLKASFEANPDVDWIALSAPLDGNGKYSVPQETAALEVNGHLIMSPNCEHPEAIIKMYNVNNDLGSEKHVLPDEVVKKFESLCDSTDVKPYFPIWQQISYKSSIIDECKSLMKKIEAEDPSGLSDHAKKRYDGIMAYKKDRYGCSVEEWNDAVNNLIGIPAADSENLNVVPVLATTLPNKFTATYSKIKTLENQYFYEIITGIKTIDAFDNYVSDFNSMGGADIIKYINENAGK